MTLYEMTEAAKQLYALLESDEIPEEAVQVDDISKLPSEYIRTKTTTEPDKTAIKKAIKSGETVDGAVLEVRNSLQIK